MACRETLHSPFSPPIPTTIMLPKGFFYLALLIAKVFLLAEARSSFSSQVEGSYTSMDLLKENLNLENQRVVAESIYEVRYSL